MKFNDYLVVCPYYVLDREGAVCCEGFHNDMQIRMNFSRRGSKYAHKKAFCRSKWAACPLAQLQNQRYDYVPPRSTALPM